MIDALRNLDFFGTTIRAEVASDKDYSSMGKKRRGKDKDDMPKYSRAGKDRQESKKDKGGKGKAKGKSAKNLDFMPDVSPKKAVKDKKDKKEKKEKKSAKGGKSGKPQYNGNYEIFYKKK